MSGLIFILLVWIFIIQLNLNELKTEIKKLKTLGKSHNNYIEIQHPNEEYITQKDENKHTEITETQDKIIKTAHKYSKKSCNDDFERLFLGNIFNKIGALALIIAIGIFIKIISPMIIFTPIIKTALGFLFGIIVIAISAKLHKDDMKSYAEVLAGTGFASLFITTYCAYGLLHTLNLPFALAIASLLLISTCMVADKLKTTSMLVISLTGGYLTPLFINSNASVFGYLLFLNALSLIFAYRNPERSVINVINLPITMIIALCFYHTGLNVLYPLVLWLMYIAYDIVKPAPDKFDRTLNWINYGVLTYFSIALFKDHLHNLGYLLAATSLIYAGIAYYLGQRHSDKFKHYLYSFIINTWIMVYFFANDVQSICIWSLEASALSFFSVKYKFYGLNKWIAFFYISIITGIFLARADHALCITAYYPSLFNPRMLIFGVPVISMFLANIIFRKCEFENCKKLSDILKFCLVTLIYLYITSEINAYFIHQNSSCGLRDFIRYMNYAIIGLIYSLHAKRISLNSKFAPFEFVSYVVGALSIFTIVTVGYSYPLSHLYHFIPALNIRFAAFGLAIASSLIFAKWTKDVLYKYIAVALGFLLIHCESSDFVREYSNLNMNYLVSLSWILYSGIITTIGILKNKDFLKISGIWLCILTILRIFIYDLATVNTIYKIVAFLVTGIILMLISYFYAKNKKGN